MTIKRKFSTSLTCLLILLSLAACSPQTADAPASPSSEATAASDASGSKVVESISQDDLVEAEWDLQFNTVTLDDEPITSENFKENILTVLNVWGTWCPPCVSELPHLQDVSERFAEKNVQIVGVLQDGISEVGVPDSGVIESAKILLADAGVTYTIILPDEVIMHEFIEEMQFFPTTFFINARGEIIETIVGANDADSWERIINEVLEGVS